MDRGQNYEIGDEVFFNKKYYRKFADFRTSVSEGREDKEDWTDAEKKMVSICFSEMNPVYGIGGDKFEVDEYRTEGLYGIGAMVEHEDKVYLCIKTPIW